MIRRTIFLALSAVLVAFLFSVTDAQAQEAYGRQWAHSYNTQDWNRMYHYPYVYYPQISGEETTTAAARICTTVIRRRCEFRSITSSG